MLGGLVEFDRKQRTAQPWIHPWRDDVFATQHSKCACRDAATCPMEQTEGTKGIWVLSQLLKYLHDFMQNFIRGRNR
jgi:hypothetical protein